MAQLVMSAREPADLELLTEGDQAVREAALNLLSLGFLVEADDTERPTVPPTPWREWGNLAWQFHTSIRNAPFVRGDEEKIPEYFKRLAERGDKPPNSKPHADDEEIVYLPRIWVDMDITFKSVLEKRRTHRSFNDEPVGLDDFSTLLHYTFGPLRFIESGSMGVLQLRASASGGARHEAEAYVVIFNVAGLQPGVYRYDAIRHGLAPVGAEVPRATIERLIHEQTIATGAAFCVFTTAVASRMAWKYPHPRAYKILLQNVGHLSQVFSMTAAALGLGAALTGAFRDDEVEELCKLDQVDEFPTFFMACGVPVLQDDGMPIRYTAPRRPSKQ
ncbi:SagB/ThcOx family dehydrogenase [Streptomyces sp. NBC_00464]|uniref:SagB/ThcOx family dehydrogenase n=1 Tax=Streptomyces sp. NBC_00464 TaxID=2975751 RepID=UPI002E17A32A